MFRAQDEHRIKTKFKMIKVNHYLLAYKHLIELIWYLFYYKEMSLKRFFIELSRMCNILKYNEERRI